MRRLAIGAVLLAVVSMAGVPIPRRWRRSWQCCWSWP